MDQNLNNKFVFLEIADHTGQLLHKQECPTAMVGELITSWIGNNLDYKLRVTDKDGTILGSL